MRLLVAALLAALLLAGCANSGASSPSAAGAPAATAPAATAPAAGAPATSAPFYLEAGWETVSVINGFTGHTEATIAAPHWAGSFPWVGHTTWYPCGAAPDDRTFLLCGAKQYEELRLGDDGKPQWTSAPADIPVAARNTGSNGDPEFAVSAGAQFAAVTTATGEIMVLSLVTGATRSWTIPAGDGNATGLSWAGNRYLAFQFAPASPSRDSGAGGVRVLDTQSAGTAALTASRLIIGTDRKLAGRIIGVFNPVITPDGSKIVAAAWTGFLVAELAEFSAQTGRLIAVLMPAAHMPGSGSPCQVLWTDSSGAHLIAYCGTAGVVNGTRFTPVHLHVPDTSGTDYTGVLLW
ncbi:MAG TPA: hypothetical protein VIX15_14800 [Streptosporangiaceae bacterium]